MVKTTKKQSYIGTITYIKDDPLELLDKPLEYHEVLIDVPGVMENIKAFPERNSLDEPKPGDLVLVTVHDPVYYSYNVYRKLKENDFIGFRSSGKMVDITPDKITIGVFEDDQERKYKDDSRPDVSKLAHLEMTSEGEITVHAAKVITINADSDVKIVIQGNSEVKISGDSKVEVSGNADIKVSGDSKTETTGTATVKGTTVNVEGTNLNLKSSIINANQMAPPTGSGPFCAIPTCPFSGAPHLGNKATGG